MNHRLLIAIAAATVATAPAHAVSTFQTDITPLLVTNDAGASADFGNTPLRNGEPLVAGKFAFQDTYTFTYSLPGTGSGGTTNNRVRVNTILRDIDFDSITFNGAAGVVSNVDGLSVASFEDVDFTGGLQTIVVTGRSTGGAAYGGNVQIINAAVPEPATWGLMALGFGLVGHAMRARRRPVFASA